MPNDPPDEKGGRTLASLQAEVDLRMFAEAPIHIIERFLDSFDDDGRLTQPIPQHILEALAVRFRPFFADRSQINSLDKAFGGKTARQRQARKTADLQYKIAFEVMRELEQIREMKPAERGAGTPYEIACEHVAAANNMSSDNVHRLYQEARGIRKGSSG
jgi:hypothetical protein